MVVCDVVEDSSRIELSCCDPVWKLKMDDAPGGVDKVCLRLGFFAEEVIIEENDEAKGEGDDEGRFEEGLFWDSDLPDTKPSEEDEPAEVLSGERIRLGAGDC